MANYRIGRVNEEMAKELMQILPTVKDPRVGNAFLSVTGVDCTNDLKYAKVYYSTMGSGEDAGDVAKGLKSASGYIRHELALRLNLRHTPELTFIRDSSVEKGAHIAKLLSEISSKEADTPDE